MSESAELHAKTDRLINLNRVEMLLASIVAICAIIGTVGAWYILPYRMTQMEGRVTSMESQRQQDHDLLIEIKTDVKLLLAKDGKAALAPHSITEN